MREVTARLYLEGARRPIRLVEPDTEAVFAAYTSETGWIQGVTVEGERFITHSSSVLDILGPAQAPEIVADPAIFDGRRITLRDYAAFLREERSRGETVFYTDYGQPAVAVLGEDMAEVLLAVVTTTGEVLWANPASAPAADARYAQIVRLAAEAATVQQREDETGYSGVPSGREASSYEESENAKTAAPFIDLVGDNPA